MKNKNGWPIGDGECPQSCNDGIACDWIGPHWKDCWMHEIIRRKREGKANG